MLTILVSVHTDYNVTAWTTMQLENRKRIVRMNRVLSTIRLNRCTKPIRDLEY